MRVPQIAKRDFERLRELIEDWCGIALEPQKTYLVESRLRELVMHHGCQTYGEFYELARRGDPELRAGIIDAMTTNETSWFRDPYWWEAMRAVILPEVIEAALREGRQRLRLWSAAASTGQELHSTSILLDEMHRSDELSGLSPGCFDLLGTDICRPALTIARAGRYDPHSMRRGLPRGLRDRHFQRAGSVWTLSEELRKRTRFEYLNLLEPLVSTAGACDLILVRNVLIYFSPSCKRDLVKRLCEVMRPDAFLVAGASESLDLYTDRLQVVRHGRAMFYRMKED